MRIRKNARVLKLMLSSSAYPPEAILQTTPHVCQLNQSPWDVRPTYTTSSFPHRPPPPSNSTSTSYPTPNQLEGGEYSLSGNASIGDAIAVVESVESMKTEMAAAQKGDIDDAPILLMGLSLNKNSSAKMTRNEAAAKDAIDDNDGNKKELKDEVKMCNKTNGKGWQCKKAAKKGYSSCERHNNNNNNDSNNNNTLSHRKSEKSLPSLPPPPPPPPQSGKVIASGVKRRGRGPGKKASTSNPYEFYYYSGFGPLWGKRRGGGEENKRNVENVKEDSPSSSSQQIEQNNKEERAQVIQFMEDEEDDEDDSGRGRGSDDNGRKRARKPVKARSLKSLM